MTSDIAIASIIIPLNLPIFLNTQFSFTKNYSWHGQANLLAHCHAMGEKSSQ